jgi:uracil-DNA glycosylase family 4
LPKEPESLKDKVQNHLSFFAEIGAEFLARGPEGAPAGTGAPRVQTASPRRTPGDASLLIPLIEEVRVCRKCRLSQQRNKAVPGEGGIETGLMFVGEGPGADEDVQGRPFVGRAGQLLTKIIEAMRYRREDVYITNIVKCRPPNNRVPAADEIEACHPYLLRQIEIVQPRVIVALGSVAAGFFVPGGMKISSLRGGFYDFGPVKVMPTYHPSYLVRNEGNRKLRKDVWDDMQKVMALLGKK